MKYLLELHKPQVHSEQTRARNHASCCRARGDTWTPVAPQIAPSPTGVRIGRIDLPCEIAISAAGDAISAGRFARTRPALVTMERVGACVAMGEPVALP